MTRKFTHYLLMSAIWFSVISCADDEISAPPKPSLQADKTSAQVGEEITFTINQVDADAVSLLPYGLPGGDGGILVKFNGGPAAVVFRYPEPGTYQPIVVANNHSGDGESVENVRSEPLTITISSNKSSITAFAFKDIDAETMIDEDVNTIEATVPYGTDVTNLTATFAASLFSTVTVGGTEQESDATANDFSSPVVYKVTADDGTSSDYTVSVVVTPVETTNTIKSVSSVAVGTSSGEKSLPVYLDNTARTIVIYDTLDTPTTQFDSIKVDYELDGEFAIMKYDGKVLEQGSVLDLTAMEEFSVYSQDSANAGGIQIYSVYAVAAPKLNLSFPTLSPDPAAAASPTNFDYSINVLSGTDVSSIKTLTSTDAPVGVNVTGVKMNGTTFVAGSNVDYSEPVEFELTVDDINAGVTYTVVYTVTVTVVP